MMGQTRAPDAPWFIWPGPWKSRQIPQVLGTLSSHSAATLQLGRGTHHHLVICTQG